jgi:hypothetical protein
MITRESTRTYFLMARESTRTQPTNESPMLGGRIAIIMQELLSAKPFRPKPFNYFLYIYIFDIFVFHLDLVICIKYKLK